MHFQSSKNPYKSRFSLVFLITSAEVYCPARYLIKINFYSKRDLVTKVLSAKAKKKNYAQS